MILWLTMLLTGCSSDEADPTCGASEYSYSQDTTLRFSHIQALGSHNSYHVETTDGAIPEWEYSHAPIGTQLATQGVRQLELDLYYNEFSGELDVLHVPVLDPGSNCPTFSACVKEISEFSQQNPAHHPLLILLEFKSAYSADEAGAWLSRAETVLSEEMGPSLLVLPSAVRGEYPTLREALAIDGWPTLNTLRGKSLFVLHSGGSLRQDYVDNRAPEDWLLFPDAGGDAQLDYAAVHSVNDPIGSFEAIQTLVESQHLVRTRADSNLEEGRALDDSRFLSALESGAHFISTDFAVPQAGLDYWIDIPEGTPSRCNPILAPASCSSSDIENPEFINRCLAD